MSSLALIALVALVSVGSGAVLGPRNQYDELFVYEQKIYATHQLLQDECPELVRMKREINENDTISLHVEVAKVVYSNLIEALTECRMKTKITEQPLARDCQELYERGEREVGIHQIKPPNSNLGSFNVSCDFHDGHGWTVIQRRFNGSVDFYKGWNEYKNGFGSFDGEHWLGNDKIHELTATNRKLSIYTKSDIGNVRHGYWPTFYINDESDDYRLAVSEDGYSGALPYGKLAYHSGMAFTTKDQDNDVYSTNCAVQYTGAWWYKSCYNVNLNGRYSSGFLWSGISNELVESTMRVTRD